jgi:molybdate transport system substrate-binding protein
MSDTVNSPLKSALKLATNKAAIATMATTLALGFGIASAQADTITVAVAANFTKAAEQIGAQWTKETGNKVRFSFGPTGGLYAQINNGAPFDAFFSADTKTPERLVKAGKATDFRVYAQGKLALYSTQLPVAKEHNQIIKAAKFNHIAVANPKAAPYGAAGVAVLKNMGMYDKLKSENKIATGESITATFQFVMTGNAQLGFVAFSQLMDPQSPAHNKGEYWLVPQKDYAPINQGAVLIKTSKHAKTAKEFMDYMNSPAAKKIIESYGYAMPE